jgi:selenide,water dikinase
MSNALTSFNPGSGCGCKMAPNDLHRMLEQSGDCGDFPGLLIGHETGDDAAVMDIGNDQLLIHTTDFFTPIIDDAFDFGRIAAANAISDVYAMGGTPSMALAILGWPVDLLPVEQAAQVIAGARSVCKQAGIPLAGGHSINIPQPLFCLSVTGHVHRDQLKRHAGAKPGDLLILTKPLGVGLLATAMKKGIATDRDIQWAIETMSQLNDIGSALAAIDGLHAMTDVTGFGLLGHAIELCEASDVSATLSNKNLPTYNMKRLMELYGQHCLPQGTTKNFTAYVGDVSSMDGPQLAILCDPQTSGGLLLSVAPEALDQVQGMLKQANLCDGVIGHVHETSSPRITIN